jgi:hypothetical protein
MLKISERFAKENVLIVYFSREWGWEATVGQYALAEIAGE